MYLTDKPILMVGSVPCDTAEQVFKLVCPEIGDLLAGISHGEPGYRNKWIVFNAPHVYEPNPGIVIVNKPKPDPDKSVFDDTPDWLPTSWEEMWRCEVREKFDEIHFESLHYADFALECYIVFRKLRDAGVIPKGVRYQVNFPFPEDFTRWCTGKERDFRIMTSAIVEVLDREIKTVLDHIPHDDLIFQWDVCWEVFACDSGDCLGHEPLAWSAGGDPYERFGNYVEQLSSFIPERVLLGMHLCYGDMGHSHLFEPKDLGVAVNMSNITVNRAGRRFDFIQMPVPRDRTDDDFFKPLSALEINDTKLYIGLVHLSDGVEGTNKRMKTFRRHYQGDFGIATECGWGRRKLETIKPLLEVHREVAEILR